MAFSQKRGRPRQERIAQDTGTPELVYKRLFGITAEAIDLCLERGIINEAQHWNGVHLRWLYTLRHGAPGVRAIDTTHIGGRETSEHNADWRAAREEEYVAAIMMLKKTGSLTVVTPLCIFNQRPAFLEAKSLGSKAHSLMDQRQLAVKFERDIEALTSGLDALSRVWC